MILSGAFRDTKPEALQRELNAELSALVFLISCVAPECPRWCELAKTVADHILGHIDRNELFAIVNGKGVSDHLRDDHGGAAPRLDHLLLAARIHFFYPVAKPVVNEWAFF